MRLTSLVLATARLPVRLALAAPPAPAPDLTPLATAFVQRRALPDGVLCTPQPVESAGHSVCDVPPPSGTLTPFPLVSFYCLPGIGCWVPPISGACPGWPGPAKLQAHEECGSCLTP
jgi:hypothetical protein